MRDIWYITPKVATHRLRTRAPSPFFPGRLIVLCIRNLLLNSYFSWTWQRIGTFVEATAVSLPCTSAAEQFRFFAFKCQLVQTHFRWVAHTSYIPSVQYLRMDRTTPKLSLSITWTVLSGPKKFRVWWSAPILFPTSLPFTMEQGPG